MSFWWAIAFGAFLGGIIGAAIGEAVWWPVGVFAAFACGLLVGVGAMAALQ